jgi:hypothetical protein
VGKSGGEKEIASPRSTLKSTPDSLDMALRLFNNKSLPCIQQAPERKLHVPRRFFNEIAACNNPTWNNVITVFPAQGGEYPTIFF